LNCDSIEGKTVTDWQLLEGRNRSKSSKPCCIFRVSNKDPGILSDSSPRVSAFSITIQFCRRNSWF